jgi:hypothetical protein
MLKSSEQDDCVIYFSNGFQSKNYSYDMKESLQSGFSDIIAKYI